MPQSGHAEPREIRFLQFGIAGSVLVYLLAGAADAAGDSLMLVTGALIGLCGVVATATASLGFVALWNLWRELLSQLRQATIGRLLVSLPLALLGLAGGFGAIILAGYLTEIFQAVPVQVYKALFWFLIAAMFWFLWKGRSHAALFLRLILLALFTPIILVSVVFALWWAASPTAYLLVFFLSIIAAINTLFYAAFVRDIALADNLVDPSSSPPQIPFL
jgi:hypothetical protein